MKFKSHTNTPRNATNRCLETARRLRGAALYGDHAALYLVALHVLDQDPGLVTGLDSVQGLVEHLHRVDHGLDRLAEADHFEGVAFLQHPLLQAPGDDCPCKAVLFHGKFLD